VLTKVSPTQEEYNFDFDTPEEVVVVEAVEPTPIVIDELPEVNGTTEDGVPAAPPILVNGRIEGMATGSSQMQAQILPPPAPKLFNMDLEKMNVGLYREKYLTPTDFVDDI
jgi:hypothetical protein